MGPSQTAIPHLKGCVMTCAHTLSFKRCPFQVAINHYFCADLRSAMGPSRCFSSPFREPRVSVIVSYYCG